jgi:hypothetical protein
MEDKNPVNVLKMLLNQAIKVADDNISKADNFDLEAFSNVLEKYVDKLNKVKEFETYTDEL